MSNEIHKISDNLQNKGDQPRVHERKSVDQRLDTGGKKDGHVERYRFNPDERLKGIGDSVKKNVEKAKLKVLDVTGTPISTEQQRIDKVPKNPERGTWTGDPGNSTFIPKQYYVKERLGKYGMVGVDYKHGIPDFSKCAAAEVKVDDMCSKRYPNFRQADIACTEKWNKEKRNGRNDWRVRDVKVFRHNRNYSWHECNDRQTMQLVPRVIHTYCKHLGGVSECKTMEGKRAEFDD